MQKIILILILTLSTMSAFAFIHPTTFKGSEAEKQKVIEFIKKDVKETYSAIGMGDASTLRMMEEEELKNFKLLTQVNDKELLDQVIDRYCSIGMCAYSTLYMMYNEELKASQQKLDW